MLERFEQFTYSIFEISRYWHRIASEEMEKYGLKGAHAAYFVTLDRFEEGVTGAQLCKLCARDKADVSRAISYLAERGLVEKESDGRPLYRGLLKLTRQGKLIAEQVKKRASLAVEMAGKNLTDEMRESFYCALESIILNLRQISQDGLPQ